jgi:glucokinase
MVMLTMGTGVGGAVVAGGELFRGGHGIGGELGHIRFTRDGLPCGCGQNGCLEQYASGRALQREANAIADAGGIGAELAALREEKGTITGPAVSRLVLAGDPGAVEALRRVATALGEACGGFQAVLDPELFVIGGGVAQLGEDLLGPVRIAYETSLPGYGDRPVANFAIAQLGNDAGLIGAADLATSEA